ncbi:MAG: repressor LexA [Deltaproteobacteria bacterium]|nr:MAG: repressor LexA [Deltaproteobacteria bacterium]
MRKGAITPKQKAMLDYIGDFTESMGYAPSQREIADHFGYSSLGTVQNFLVRLEKAGWLERSWNAKRALKTLSARTSAGSYELPMLGFVAAGKPIEAVESPDTMEVPETMMGRGENFVLKVEGDSMVGDGILDGDMVVVTKASYANNGQTVVAMVDGEATVKHFHRVKEGIELRSANPLVPTINVTQENEFRIGGIVVGVIRHC